VARRRPRDRYGFSGGAVAWTFAAASRPEGRRIVWLGALVALLALTAVFARAIAAARRVQGRPDGRDDRRRDRGTARRSSSSSRSGKVLSAALFDARGAFAPGLAVERLFAADIWGLGCLGGGTRCGVAINSAILATIVGLGSTSVGLVLALVVQRGGKRYAGIAKVMSILPIVTPPFVIALALVVLFGRTGLVTGWLDSAFGIPRSRWIYGLPGVTIAQLLTVLADRVHAAARRARRDQPGARGSGADAARVALARVPHRDLAAAASRRSRTRSCSASSRASPTSATRSCSPATTTCCRPRSSSRSPARSTIRGARRRSRSCCSRSRWSRSTCSSAGSASCRT
jgi:hypothetical protein